LAFCVQPKQTKTFTDYPQHHEKSIPSLVLLLASLNSAVATGGPLELSFGLLDEITDDETKSLFIMVCEIGVS
jgi:hypothetical protein